MAGNSFGEIFKIHTFGESHGVGIGVIIDGCPPGIIISEDVINKELERRKPGQSKITTQRKEADKVIIQSGIFEGKTTGTPISLFIANQDQKSKDYSHIKDKFRPSHADKTYDQKYGHRDYRGGGRSSARETVARVAAGAIAKSILKKHGVAIHAGVTQVGKLKLQEDIQKLDFSETENNVVRCPNSQMAAKMESLILDIKKQGNTIGGVISCLIKNCPPGIGDPVFDKLHADLGKAMLSINAVKGFEYGSGFGSVSQLGSDHNDAWINEEGTIKTSTNFSGGIQGGISNGMPIYFNVAFKPVATIMKDQTSIDKDGIETTVKGKGRHDPCVVPRAVPIVEAMAALVICDHILRQKVNL
ncbi:MAG: chorismate synthase [Saprospiraceae bacterium]|nr:chorismate synthase [Bacteroidia bacterium]NNL91799.1 chorismate synthase [Saprospiraceae bacterium]